jgi:hypothetical protein
MPPRVVRPPSAASKSPDPSSDEVERLFDALKGWQRADASGKTFWSPLFGMCTDKFGVACDGAYSHEAKALI